MDSLRKNDHSSLELTDAESQHVRRPKWPATFWFILKVLCLYHHRKVVTSRQCFQCHVRENIRKRRVDGFETIGPENLDWLVTQYESSSSSSSGIGTGEEAPLLNGEQTHLRQSCEACATLWWNANGVPEKYTEKDIGVGSWNHRGSGLLSALLLLGALSLILYDVGSFMVNMWARSENILALIIRITFHLLLAVYPVLTLCSKLRSWFTTGVPNLSWASALNVRYLIKRAQMLDIGRRGLPGKHFLVAFSVCALSVSLYRFIILAYIAGCGYSVHVIVTCVFGFIFAGCCALFMYIVYFIRTSFQRQFTLLTYFIKEHEGSHLAGSNGVLFAAIEDYACFKMLCNLLAFFMCPVLVFAISANITNEYSLTDSCVVKMSTSWNIMNNVAYLSWIEMAMAFGSYVIAIGGLQVEYLLNNFITNLFHLKSDEHQAFWKALLHDILSVAKGTHVFLFTVVLSFLSFFTAFNFDGEDQSVMCNATYHEKFCV